MADEAGKKAVAVVSRILRLPTAHVSSGSTTTFGVATISAMLMFGTAVILGVLVPVATGEFHYFQPSERAASMAELVRPSNEHPGAAVAYFTVDSGFVIAFTLVFVGLFVLTRSRAPQFAAFGLGAGVWTGIADAAENSVYWTAAMRAHAGDAITELPMPELAVLSNLKMVGFFAAYLTFALVLRRRDWLERLTTIVLLLPPSVGLVSLGVPALGDLRPVLLAAPSLPLILLFARAWSARLSSMAT